MCNQEEDIKVSQNIKNLNLEFCEEHKLWNTFKNKVAYYEKGWRVAIDCLKKNYSM